MNTAYHAVTRRAEVKSYETVFLFGLGGLGFNALQIVRSIGARVIVCDIRQELLDAAAEIGVPPEDIVPVGKSPVEFVAEGGLLIDTVLDFVGTHQTFDDAQEIGESSRKKRGVRGAIRANRDSSARRKTPLHRQSRRREHDPYEDGHAEETELHLLVWWTTAGLEGGVATDCKGEYHAARRGGQAGRLPEGAPGIGGRQDQGARCVDARVD